jgi:homoserine kinase type II
LAVYTHLSKEDIAALLMHYDIGELETFKGIAEGVENTNYLIITQKGAHRQRYILTLYEQRVNPDDLPFFLGLTEWLANRGIACPRPVRSRDDQMTASIKGKTAALIHFLEGRGNPHITPRHLELTGELLARMHLAGEGFPITRRNTLSLDGWRALFQKFRGDADAIAPGLEKEISAEFSFLEKHWPQGLPSGVIHADVFPDNVFFIDEYTDQPELSGIIDFYFACNDAWIYDVIICMNAWCFDTGHKFVPVRAKALLDTYNRIRPITEAERAAMPVLARGAAMRFLMTRAHDWLIRVDGALVNPKDPMEYVTKLRFHQRIGDYREYGLS